MEFFRRPPDWLTRSAPEGVRTFLENGGWYVVLGALGLIVLLLLWIILRGLGRAFSRKQSDEEETPDLTEDLEVLPAAPPLTGDRRLTVDGVPVRLRLIVLAPAGRAYDINPAAVPQILDRILPGLGQICVDDQPQMRIWPFQLSYEGFANQFHNHMSVREKDNEPSRWVLLAGRAQFDRTQVMLGLALQSQKPTTVGRRRLDRHEWAGTLRIRTRE